MLRLKNIVKLYGVGDVSVKALNNVSLNFRESEFVAILGPSGSGKTTLLNIIGGLDHYTTGDLIINGVPTNKYKDSDWDTYRNHSVGFVFQSYNLIPHQTILSNVELALTLSGVSKTERRRRAAEALEKVGLSSQINKRPNQLSGGQMQRVAIARAIVNEPDILLADEPTGALDSETSVQIMEIIKEIAKDRLVIMVTHNPELAQKYATRIIQLKDGEITDDSNPCSDAEVPENELKPSARTKEETRNESRNGIKKGKRSMSFFTALSLSLNNLRTKKGRTFLTSFAGSIGIIGIALIMALSNGIQLYINRVQEDTLSSYPITIEAETADMSSILSSVTGKDSESETEHDKNAVYENMKMYELMNSMVSIETSKNNLKSFKSYLDKQMNPTLSTTDLYKIATVKYLYDAKINVLTTDPDGNIIKSDYTELVNKIMSSMGMSSAMAAYYTENSYSSDIWTELLKGENGSYVSDLLKSQYDVIDGGRWPEAYNEIVLIVNKNNEISDIALYALGLKSADEMSEAMQNYMAGITTDTSLNSWTYDEIKSKTYKLVLSPDMYLAGDGSYTDISESQLGLESLYANGTELKIVGIVRQNENATSGMLSGTIGYTSALTDYIIQKTSENSLVKAQLEDPSTDVLTGLPFKDTDAAEKTDEEKIAAVREYIENASEKEKAEIYISLVSVPSDEYIEMILDQYASQMTRDTVEEYIIQQYPQYEKLIKEMDDETLNKFVRESLTQMICDNYVEQIKEELSNVPDSALSLLLDSIEISDEQYLELYETMPKEYSDSTYEDNLSLFGYVTEDNPSGIYIYASTFSDKDKISDIIQQYNNSVEENDQITYTDYVKLLMSSITTIINVITYVLIAFVAISLVVSSIMIGIITYISVLERTKEIGILRSIGASKRDVSRVFNAEALTVGFLSGIIGIGLSLLLCIPINAIIRLLSGISNIGAVLPVAGAVALVLISMFLTFIAGLIPSSVAAKKDPVTALRSE